MPATAVTASFRSSLFIEQIPNCCSLLGSRPEEYGGRAAPYMSRSYGIGIEGSGGTLQISAAHGN